MKGRGLREGGESTPERSSAVNHGGESLRERGPWRKKALLEQAIFGQSKKRKSAVFMLRRGPAEVVDLVSRSRRN